VAGVIKMVMAIRHETLPASLHIDEPSPHVDWDSGRIQLLTQPVRWQDVGRPRRAGVSSFGVSGTNAHLILEEAPEPPEQPEPVRVDGAVPWVVSARSREALRGQAAALAAHVAGSQAPPADVGWSLVTSRSAFEHRAVVVGEGRAELLAGLRALAQADVHPGVVEDVVGGDGPGPVLVFPGQGSQWAGMGAGLLESSPVFAARVADCERALAPHVDWSLTEVLRGDGAELDRVDVVQPVLWATMVSLAAVWAAHGVIPAAVVGHSQGEIAAACVAGALSLEDGAKIAALRSQALRQLAGGGAMASLSIGREQAEQLLGEQGTDVVVAAVNGPSSTVVSGPPDQVAAIVAKAEADGLRARTIDVDYASHGPQIDQITDELHDVLAGIRPAAAQVAFYSTVTAARIDTSELDTGYWVTNLRRPVRFADAVEALLDDGHRLFIEASPHPVLTIGMQETFEQTGIDAAAVPTLRRDHGGRTQLAHALAQAFTTGTSIDWRSWFPTDPTPRTVELPTYAFQRERYWLDTDGGVGDLGAAGLRQVGHALLPAAVGLADGGLVLTGRLSQRTHPWLADHQILGTVLVPGAALVEWALRAADEAGCAGVEELVLRAPLVLPASGSVRVQVVVEAAGQDGRRDVKVYSRPDHDDGDGAEWVCHAAGVLGSGAGAPAEGLAGVWPPPDAEPVSIDDFYERTAAAGYEYGPAFQGLRALWRDGPDLLAELVLPETGGRPGGFGIHPALLDAALHPALLDDEPGDGGQVWLPFAWTGVTLWAGEATTIRVRLSPQRGGERGVRMVVADAVGAPVLTTDAMVMRPADTDQLRAASRRGIQGLFAAGWIPLPAASADTARSGPDDEGWAVLGPNELGLNELGLNGASHTDLGALVTVLDTGTPAPSVVLTHLRVLRDSEEEPLRVAETLARLVRDWLAEPRLADTRLVVITQGVGPGGTSLSGAAAWGLVRGAQAEDPGKFVLVDLDDSDDAVEAVRRAVGSEEPQVAVRAGRLLVPRLARTTPEDDRPPILVSQGTVLITADTGPLAGLIAEHLARTQQAGHLLLAGPHTPGTEHLTELGVHVQTATVDLTDAAAVTDLITQIDPAHPLTAIIHTTPAAPNARPAWAATVNLHTATKDLPLERFVIFSSAAATLGSAEEAGQTAIHALCDALAAHRRAADLPALSLAWGPWTDEARLSRLGVKALSAQHGLALFDAAVQHGGHHLLAIDLDARALADLPVIALPAPLRGLADTGAARRTAAGRSSTDWAGRLAALPPDEQHSVILDLVLTHAAAVLGHADPGRLQVERGFLELGVDSLTALELRNRLVTATDLQLPSTVVFDYPNPGELARHLHAELAPQEADTLTSMLNELDKLESALLTVAQDKATTATLKRRLQTTFARLDELHGGEAERAVTGKLETATASEIFDFIDQELGKKGSNGEPMGAHVD
jgi:polyketide synthase 12